MFTEAQLNELISRPSAALVDTFDTLDGDIMIIGAGGKVGPTLSVMAKRANDLARVKRNVYAVSRFSDPYARALMNEYNVSTIDADLTDDKQIAALPKVKNIIFMAGRKFGTSSGAHETWMMNVIVPGMVTRHFGDARYVVFSTGNVYPLARVSEGGWLEETPPAPVGEYAMTSLGRERVFEYAAAHYGAKALMFRLSYAIDLRYGVLYDIGSKILADEPISLNVPAFNCVWQGYSNDVALRALGMVGERVEYLNVTNPEIIYVRDAALAMARALGKDVKFKDEMGDFAFLSDVSKCVSRFGAPEYSASALIDMQARWLLTGGRHLDKPTHFEESGGKY